MAAKKKKKTSVLREAVLKANKQMENWPEWKRRGSTIVREERPEEPKKQSSGFS